MYDKRYTDRRESRVDEEILRRVIEHRSPTGSGEYRTENENLNCQRTGTCMPALAMVYTPKQSFRNLYSEEKGITRGTIFAELDKPFLPNSQRTSRGGNCNGCKM